MSLRIAVIDDDRSIRHFLDEYLKLKGLTVDIFTSAEEVLPKLQSGSYDLAIMDVVLPGISGLEACRQLHNDERTRDLPVILMSAINRTPEQINAAREEYGAADYLLKPFSLDRLYSRIGELTQRAAPDRSESASGLPRLQGHLADTSFAQVLHDLYALQATGLLHISLEERKKVVYVLDGYPIFVRSNVVRECLGNVLVNQGIINERECENSLRAVRETGRLQGTVLIEMGLITPQQLHDLLTLQASEKLLEIFGWADGEYRFAPAADIKQSVTRIRMSPANLIYSGLRTYYSEERLESVLRPHLDRYPALSQNPHFRFQDIELNAREARFIADFHGAHTCRTLLDRFPLSRFENMQLLAALFLSHLLESHDAQLPVSQRSSLFADPPEVQQKREAFLKDYARMMKQDYFALFGIEDSADQETLRRSYVGLAKKYHPDRYQQDNFSRDLRQKVNALFQHISEAYEILSQPGKRQLYLQQQHSGGKTVQDQAGAIIQAETFFQQGLSLVRKGNFTAAHDVLEKAVELYGNEAEYLCYLALAKFRTDTGDDVRKTQAQVLITRALQMNNNLDIAHLFHGYMLKDAGKEREAEKRFELAIQRNPNCTEALRELRLMRMRRTDEEGGVLGKLFKK
jgi:DNA-binding response OmpR family regulator/curved DNA-binding protein CbpA